MPRSALTILALLLALGACQAGEGTRPVSGLYVGGSAGVGQADERVDSGNR